jgi:hypothetical protein
MVYLMNIMEKINQKPENISKDGIDSQEVAKKASKLLTLIEEETKLEIEKPLIDPRSVKERILELYTSCIEMAKMKDGDGIIVTYIQDLYDPSTTKLDDCNLLLNLSVLSILQELNIIDFYFDDGYNNPHSTTYDLNLDWYSKILSQPVEDQAKYVHILESNFKLIFYKSMFNTILKSADKMAYNKNSVKMKNFWNFLDDETSISMDIEDYLVEFIEGRTSDGSVIMVTPDLTPYFNFDLKNNEEYSEKPYIKYSGKWKNRFVYEIDTNQVTYLKGFKRGAFFIKEGNKYVINPSKPLVYSNIIKSPFREEPILFLFENMDFNFYQSSTTFLRVEDM